LLTAAGLLAGCSYQIRPEAPRSMPLTREGALGLRVGVIEDEQSQKGWLRRMPNLSNPRKVTDALRYCGLFREVEGVRRGQSSGYDLVVDWTLELKHHVGIFPFLPLCDPLILGCFLDNKDRSESSINATVTDSSGRTLKSYSVSQEVQLIYKIGALNRRQDSMISAVENALANLITAFINDREFYRGLKPGSGPASQPAAPASAATAASPVPAAAEPSPVPAEAPAAPQVLSSEAKTRLQYEIDNLQP
jgi:hypothetical protein